VEKKGEKRQWLFLVCHMMCSRDIRMTHSYVTHATWRTQAPEHTRLIHMRHDALIFDIILHMWHASCMCGTCMCGTYMSLEWVVSQIYAAHKWGMPHLKRYVAYECKHVCVHVDMCVQVLECVVSHISMPHGTHTNTICAAYKWPHLCAAQVCATQWCQLNESCHSYKCCMAHIQIRHVPHTNEAQMVSLMNEVNYINEVINEVT